MDLGHHIYSLLLEGKLCLAPISPNAQRVLDLGTGTGIWAIDFAEFVLFPTLGDSRPKLSLLSGKQ
jgi:ubiquinone/menaquinone biosynthesis C-methylase UbiE